MTDDKYIDLAQKIADVANLAGELGVDLSSFLSAASRAILKAQDRADAADLASIMSALRGPQSNAIQ